jgi:hypothetical protein
VVIDAAASALSDKNFLRFMGPPSTASSSILFGGPAGNKCRVCKVDLLARAWVPPVNADYS